MTSANTSSSHPFILEWGESGMSKPGFFSFPQNLAIDDSGNIYVTDLGNKRVQKFNNDGTFLHAWGSGGIGSGEFNSPAGIAAYDNSVYVVDNELHRIQKFNLTGNFVSKWGSGGEDAGQFLLPNGVAIGENGTVYVVDTGNHRIQKFTSDGQYLSEFGQNGNVENNLQSPIGIVIDNEENVYVSEPGNNRIVKFDSRGVFVTEFGPNAAGFSIMPQGMTADPLGNLYVADTGNDRILRLDQNGLTLSSWGMMGTLPGQFKMPKDIDMDSNGNLFIVDSYGHRIQKFGSPINPAVYENYMSIIPPQTEETTGSGLTNEETVNLSPPNPVPDDFTKPTIIPPNDLLIEATGGLTPVSIGQALATDESGIQSLTNNAPAQFSLGETTVIWTAIDGAGNMAIATQAVRVVDTIPPTISPLPEITIEAISAGENAIVLNLPAISDAVGVISITNDAPDVFSLGETLVSWTATDVVGNTASITQKVTVVDTTVPTLHVPDDIIVEATSFDQNAIYVGEAVVIDNGEIVSITNDAPQFFSLGDTTVTWVAADSAGNGATSQQLITVIDTTAPEITAPDDIVFEATSENENIVPLGSPTVIDVQNVEITNDAPSVFPMGEIVVVWAAIDPAGNFATVSQKVTVVDTSSPILNIPDDITIEATSPENNVVALGDIIADDVSGIASISNNSPEYFPLGITLITWTITDTLGNTATGEQTVTVVDTTPPEIIVPVDLLVEALDTEQNFVDLGQPSVYDLIAVESVTNDAPESFPIGMITITWTATDTSGNAASASQVVTVQDTTAPAVIVPNNIVLEATSPSGMVVDIGEATATDPIGIESITNNAPGLFYLGETTITWTATDTHGNSATATQSVTIIDTTAPTIVPPADVVYEALDATSNVVSIGVASADDVAGVISVENDALEVFPVGDTLVTWTATDAAGNIGTATQRVSITDSTPPTIIAPDDIQAEATSVNETIVNLADATASDFIGIKSITNDAPSVFPVGDTVVTWTATDLGGLTSTDTQIVSVVDTTSPTLTVSDLITVEATSEDQNIILDFGTITADDLVGVASIENDAPAAFPFGLTTITWTASDEAGNLATAQQQVHVIDTTAPTIVAPDDLIIEAADSDSIQEILGNAQASDAVSLASITNNLPDMFTLGETVVTWTAVDSAGNSVSATQVVTIVDTTPPTIMPSDDIVVEASSATNNLISLVPPYAEDSASSVTVTNNAPPVFPLGETIITWIATDVSGNAAASTQKITVVDTTPPQLIIPEDVTIDATSLQTPVFIGEASVSDLADSSPTITNNAPFSFPLGETVVTWTAIDSFGNSVTATQTINVQACGKPASSYNMIMGTPADDILYGTNVADLIFAQEGDDIVLGSKGSDCIFGGEGDDIIFGNEGNDNISGGEGSDILKGQSGSDIVNGGANLDVIDGGDDYDACTAGEDARDLKVKCEA